MENQECIFCKIAKNEIPSKKIHEDEKFLAFLDIRPAAKGHALVIPKSHYETFLDMPENEVKELFGLSQKLAKSLKEKLSAKYVFLLVMGEEVPHTHVHLIPSYEDTEDPFPIQLGSKIDCDLDAVLAEIKGDE